jgi:hypothetical protein
MPGPNLGHEKKHEISLALLGKSGSVPQIKEQ